MVSLTRIVQNEPNLKLYVLPCADTNLNFQVSFTCTLKKEQHLKKRDEGVGKKERKTSKFCLRTDSKMIEM